MKGSFSRVRTPYVIAMLLANLGVACKSEDQPPPQQGGYPQQQYPQQQQQYPQQQYPQQTAPAPAAPAPAAPAPAAPAPAAPAPAAPAQMSQPGPAALPCSTDAQCLLHRCNTQFGKCAFPCATDADCNPGNRCQAPLCIPGAPAQ
ncbi:MAG: hypothetical protein ACOY0T_39995 [Myxococcota bacterium]